MFKKRNRTSIRIIDCMKLCFFYQLFTNKLNFINEKMHICMLIRDFQHKRFGVRSVDLVNAFNEFNITQI